MTRTGNHGINFSTTQNRKTSFNYLFFALLEIRFTLLLTPDYFNDQKDHCYEVAPKKGWIEGRDGAPESWQRLRIVLGPSAARNSRLYNPITKYSCQKLAVRYVCDLKQLEMEEEIPLDQLLNILPPEPSSN